jgi:polysaccharide deacetylase family protein (PEP-CTERM system associated)
MDLNSTPKPDKWDSFPSYVEKNFLSILDILEEKQISSTCFFLGWVANRYPALVRSAIVRGHEVASHGFAHRLIYKSTPDEFLRDVSDAKKAVEDASGRKVLGYRAPGFSVTSETPWVFDVLIEAGYEYDSSVFPARRGHGGLDDGQLKPYVYTGSNGSLVEFPVSVVNVMGRNMCFFGGGYLRLFPLPIIRSMADKVLLEGRPVIFYVHPREIDKEAPRLPMGLTRRFKSYVNISTTRKKISSIMDSYDFCTFEQACKYFQSEAGPGQ